MSYNLLVKHPLKRRKQSIELLGLNHGPRDDCKLSGVQSADEIELLLGLNNILELETESSAEIDPS